MLNEVCAYLNNWFDVNDDHEELPSWRGEFTITRGTIDLTGKILDGQYFRIQNSIFNNGVYKYPADNLKDETFNGKISAMAVPSEVETIAGKIAEWCEKNGGADSTAYSPFNSESFRGYSYSKGSLSEPGNCPLWWSVFGGDLARYRKL